MAEISLNDVRAEIQSLLGREDYKYLRGALENLLRISYAELMGQPAATPEALKKRLDQIKEMQSEIAGGAQPVEVFEKAIADSSQPPPAGAAGAAPRHHYDVKGDAIRPERDAYKAENIYFINNHVLFSESLKEAKKQLDKIPVPVVLFVMTAVEAAQLDEQELYENFNDPVYPQQLRNLREVLSREQIDDALHRYGPRPEDWRPFRDSQETIGALLAGALRALPGFTKPLEPSFKDVRVLTAEPEERTNRALMKLLREKGCIVIVDVISMQHPVIQRAYRRSLLDVYPEIPVAKLAPSDSVLRLNEDVLLNFSDRYRDLEFFKRVEWDSDDNCREVSRASGLRQWVNGCVPDMLKRMEEYKQARENAQSAYKDVNGAA